MHTIDKNQLVHNLDSMINLLEYDAMRSPGKAKLNSGHLESLHSLRDRYTKELAAVKPAPKKAAVKEAAED